MRTGTVCTRTSRQNRASISPRSAAEDDQRRDRRVRKSDPIAEIVPKVRAQYEEFAISDAPTANSRPIHRGIEIARAQLRRCWTLAPHGELLERRSAVPALHRR